MYCQAFLAVMRHSQFVPLPVSPRHSCSSSFFYPASHILLTPGDSKFQQNFCQTSEGSTSGSETLTPSTMSDREDILANSENWHTPSLLDAGEYIDLTDPQHSVVKLCWNGCILIKS